MYAFLKVFMNPNEIMKLELKSRRLNRVAAIMYLSVCSY